MSSREGTPNAAVHRALRIMEILAHHGTAGLQNKDIASAIPTSEVNVCRDLKTLEMAGWAAKTDTGSWALTPKPAQIGLAMARHLDEQITRLETTRQRIFAGANNYTQPQGA